MKLQTVVFTGKHRLVARLRDDNPEQGSSLELVVISVAIIEVAVVLALALLSYLRH